MANCIFGGEDVEANYQKSLQMLIKQFVGEDFHLNFFDFFNCRRNGEYLDLLRWLEKIKTIPQKWWTFNGDESPWDRIQKKSPTKQTKEIWNQ